VTRAVRIVEVAEPPRWRVESAGHNEAYMTAVGAIDAVKRFDARLVAAGEPVVVSTVTWETVTAVGRAVVRAVAAMPRRPR
jgi:hypothetical protein